MRAPLLAALLTACASAPPVARGTPSARLPTEEGDHLPSLLTVDAGSPLSVEALADVQTCAGCHPAQAAEWRSSAHAFASFDNPWYRQSVDALADDAGHLATRHCAGCHDPAPLLAGAMDRGVSPDDPLAMAGVTCLTCHGAVSATSEGQASLVLSGLAPLPRDGDAASLEAHKAAMGRDTLTSPLLCASCHRGVLGPGTGNPDRLVGQDDAGGWKGSAWAGATGNVLEAPIEGATCAGCHMEAAEVNSVNIHSHRFPGAQTAMAGAAGDGAQLAAIQEKLQQAATVDLGVWVDGALVGAGAVPGSASVISLDAIVRNVGAGHTLPGGPRDTQDLWISLRVQTARGQPIAASGLEPGDPSATRLDAGALDEHGARLTLHHTAQIRASAWDHGVPARGARAFRYTVSLPDGLTAADWPLEVEVALKHRRHQTDLLGAACEATQSARGQAFAATSLALGRRVLDGCAEAPVTVMASAALELGPGAGPGEGGAARAPWDRAFDHALALSAQLPEALSEAEQALERLGPLAGSTLERAQVLWLEAVIDGRQGRVQDAVHAAAEARALIGPHPALSRAEGRALAQVWRWEEAADALEMVTRLSPGDTAGWREWAVALSALGRSEAALDAARAGLALAPHDPDLLRVQALSLTALGAADADEATAVWLAFRGPDQAADLALACEQTVEGCARARAPVPELALP